MTPAGGGFEIQVGLERIVEDAGTSAHHRLAMANRDARPWRRVVLVGTKTAGVLEGRVIVPLARLFAACYSPPCIAVYSLIGKDNRRVFACTLERISFEGGKEPHLLSKFPERLRKPCLYPIVSNRARAGRRDEIGRAIGNW
jgi:hypothetical protein